MQKIREIKFNKQNLKFVYRDDSDLSVIEEFFVDHMYKSVEEIIAKTKDPILDIGAHIGIFSIYSQVLSANRKTKSEIIALEPEPNNFKLLKENLKLNHCKNVKVKQYALVANDSPSAVLYLSENTHNHSTASESDNFIGVPAVTLEKLIEQNKIKKIGLLKMDIEGAEYDIIFNLQSSILNSIQNLVVEYHPVPHRIQGKPADYLSNIIRQNGFSVEHFPNQFDKRFGLLVCRNKR